MVKLRSNIIAALDLGTSKVGCFIARIDERGRPRVIGMGHQASKGIKSGTIVDMDAVEYVILNVVHAAEQMAGERIQSVFVNVSGGQPISHSFDIELPLSGHPVNDHDLQILQAQKPSLPPSSDGFERDIIHSIPVHYLLDGTRGIRDPRGMYGQRLGANIHVVSAHSNALRNLTTCVRRCHLEVDAFVVSPYASGLACLVEDEMDLGVTLIDMGGGTTSIAVFFDGNVVYTDTIPIGGGHVTHDIARGLSTPLSHAERLKTLYGSAVVAASDTHEMIDVVPIGEEDTEIANHVPKSLMTGIVQPRIEETFELVRSHLEASGFAKLAGRRAVLTGGASQLSGVREVASLILDKQIRLGKPIRLAGLAEATGGPSFAASAGMLAYALLREKQSKAAKPANENASWFGRLHHWLQENL
ncbi:MAG: cell division protein FtsA [Dongiaceae bacterium]